MKFIRRLIGCCLLLCVAWGAMASDRDAITAEFVGTSPCDALPREFVGDMAATTPCHCITWQLTLFTNTYKLVANYGLPGRNDPNQIEEGAQVEQQGTWKILKGTKANPNAVVYQLTSNKTGKS